MKKANAVLPVIMVMLSFLVVRPLAMATPETNVFVDPKESNVEMGQTFAVNISIANVTGLLGFDFHLSYNTTVLQLVSISEGPFMKSVDYTFVINLTTVGQVWLAIVLYDPQGPPKSANGSGVLATATFKALAVGESLLDLFSKDPYNPDEIKLVADPPPDSVVAIPNVAIDGHVIVSPDPPGPADPPNPTTPPIVGDVNSDGKVDMKDVGLVARLFRASLTDPLWNPNCDINGDGKIDMRDIGIVASNIGDHN